VFRVDLSKFHEFDADILAKTHDLKSCVFVLQSTVKLDFVACKSPQMPKKNCAKYTHLKNMAKARQKRSQDIRPGMWYSLMLEDTKLNSHRSPRWK
jgi:hypothetical protein